MRRLRLLKIYALICSFAAMAGTEFLLSQMTGSLVLLLDSYHNLFTLLSLVLLVISHRLQDAPSLKNTFGWIRIEILGTLFNLIFFAALLFSILVECIQTLAHSGHEDVIPVYPLILVIAGSAGLCLYLLLQLTVGDLMKKDGCYLSITGDEVMVNRVVADPVDEEMVAGPSGELRHDTDSGPGVIINRKQGSTSSSIIMQKLKLKLQSKDRTDLRPDDQTLQQEMMTCDNNNDQQTHSLNQLLTPESRMQLRHVMRDFGTSFLLIISGLVVIFDNENSSQVSDVADAMLGIGAVLLLYLTIYPTMKQSGYILLQTIPKHIDVLLLKQNLVREFRDSVLSVHDLHVWCLTSSTVIATCHVTIKQSRMSSYPLISRSIEKFFAREGISSATIQPEFLDEQEFRSSSYPCLYKCSNTELDCQELRCCHETTDECEAVICAGVNN